MLTRAKRRTALEAARPYALLPGFVDTYSTVCTFVSPAMHARCAREACACPCHQPDSRYATGDCDLCGRHFETLDALEVHRDHCTGAEAQP